MLKSNVQTQFKIQYNTLRKLMKHYLIILSKILLIHFLFTHNIYPLQGRAAQIDCPYHTPSNKRPIIYTDLQK